MAVGSAFEVTSGRSRSSSFTPRSPCDTAWGSPPTSSAPSAGQRPSPRSRTGSSSRGGSDGSCGVSWLALLAVPLLPVGIADHLHLRLDWTFPAAYPTRTASTGLAWVVPVAHGRCCPARRSASASSCIRALFGDPQTRQPAAVSSGFMRWRRRRVRALGVVAVFSRFPSQQRAVAHRQHDVYISLIAIPVAFIHGVFRYGAFGVRTAGRAAPRSVPLSLLIGHPVCVRGRRTGDPPRPRADGGPSRGHHRRRWRSPSSRCARAPRVRPPRTCSATGTASSPCWSSSEPSWSRPPASTRCSTSSPPPSGRAPGLVDAHPPPRRGGGVVPGAARPGGRRDRATDGDPRPRARRPPRRSHRGGAEENRALRAPRARPPRHHAGQAATRGRECGPGRPARAASGRAVRVAGAARRGPGRRAAPHRTRPA